MNTSNSSPNKAGRVAQLRSGGAAATTDQTASMPASTWKKALSKLARPAFRLHRYRNARTMMLQGAYYDLDCRRED
jgi:hypothetical protein